MKIALIGYGKMGKMIHKIASEKGHEITAIIDPSHSSNTLNESAVAEADICIDFTSPGEVVKNIVQLAKMRKNIVVGTTDWEPHFEEIRKLVEKTQIGLLHDSNFSIGMHFFMKIVQNAAQEIMRSDNYDVAGLESHHKQKLDSPSGTAKMIGKAVLEATNNTVNIPFTSVRCGSIPGTHTILFDSGADTITLTHTARSRIGFAEGAVEAAEWLKEKRGFYTLSDMLQEKQYAHDNRPLYSFNNSL